MVHQPLSPKPHALIYILKENAVKLIEIYAKTCTFLRKITELVPKVHTFTYFVNFLPLYCCGRSSFKAPHTGESTF